MRYLALLVVVGACGDDRVAGSGVDMAVGTDVDTRAGGGADSAADTDVAPVAAADSVGTDVATEVGESFDTTVAFAETVESDAAEADTEAPDTITTEDVACVPDCTGKTCGPDGCGGSCGACESWLATFGTVANPNAVAVDAAHRVVAMAFGYETGLDFGNGATSCPTDVWVPTLVGWEKTGELAFARCFPGWELNVDGFGNGRVAVEPDQHIVMAGSMNGRVDWGFGPSAYYGGFDAYVVRLTPRGTPLWARVFGDAAYQGVSALAVGPDGGIVLAIANTGTLEIDRVEHSSRGGTDIVLVKLDASGKTVWVKDFGDAGLEQVVTAMGLADNGDILIAGAFSGALELGGEPLVAPGPDDHSHDDAFIARLSGMGEHVWSRQFHSTSAAIHNASFASDGGSVVTGTLQADEDVTLDAVTLVGGVSNFIVSFDGAGVARWAYKPDEMWILPAQLLLEDDGSVWVGTDAGLSTRVDRWDPNGQPVASIPIGSSFLMGLARDDDATVIVGTGPVNLDVPTNPAGGQGWVLRWADAP